MRNLCLFALVCAATYSNSISQTSELSDKQVLQSLYDSSTTAYDNGKYNESLEYNIKLIKRASKLKDTIFLQKGYRNIAYDYLELQDTTQARINFVNASTYAALLENDTIIGENYMDLANFYIELGAAYEEKTFAYYQKSIDFFEKTQDSSNLSNVYFNLSSFLIDANKFDRLVSNLQKTTALIPYGGPHFEQSVNNLWGKYYLHRKEYDMACLYYTKVINDTIAPTSNVEIEVAYYNNSEALYKQGKFKEAYDARLKAEEYTEKNNNIQLQEQSQELVATFQLDEYKKNLEKKELRNQLQVALVKSQNNWNKFLIIVAISSILLVIFLYRHYRIRKEYVQKLKAKSKEYLQAKNESEELAKAKTKFFSTVSHELRTPLYGVIGLTTVLMDDPKLKSNEEDLKSLKFSADYLLALINDVLQVNKIDSKTLEEYLEEIDIREFIENIVSSFEFMRIQNSNKIHISIDPNLPQIIITDTTRLSQILMNIIGNACKFTQAGDIYINLEEKKRIKDCVSILFTIKDSGIGIPVEKQLIIFDEFSQVGSNHNTYQGTGLGLPIVKKLLDLSDTSIYLSSKVGEGSTFSFTLDLAFTNNTLITQTEIKMAHLRELKGKKILIVDDNQINQIVTKKILTKSEVECTITSNGQEAVDIVKASTFDLILMDINMPVKDGLTATREIRDFDEVTPIIALTAVEVKEMRCKIYNAGLTDIIIKPYDIEQFKQTILRNISQKNWKNTSREVS